MRPSCAAALLLTVLLSAGAGCQQTSQTTAGTPTTPIGPLAPAAPGAAGPSLGPFGAPTRVPPPATGSYNAPNNYLGDGAAGGQAYSPTPAPPTYASAPGRLQPLSAPASAAPLQQPAIGSGVRQTGWSGPDGTVGQTNSASTTPRAPASAGAANPRLGGMPVNDLTGAPPPPGYLPQPHDSPQPRYSPQRYRAGSGAFRGYRQAHSTADSLASPAGVTVPSGADRPSRTAGITAGGDSTGAPVPMRPELPASAASRHDASAEEPSTEPATDRDGESKLPWRRPGSQY